MDNRIKLRFNAQAQIMKALGHPTRLFLINELAEQELCVCEMTEMIGADTSTISKHLSILKNAGLVSFEKRGTNIYYSLKMPCVLNFFNCIDQVLKNRLEEQASFLD